MRPKSGRATRRSKISSWTEWQASMDGWSLHVPRETWTSQMGCHAGFAGQLHDLQARARAVLKKISGPCIISRPSASVACDTLTFRRTASIHVEAPVIAQHRDSTFPCKNREGTLGSRPRWLGCTFTTYPSHIRIACSPAKTTVIPKTGECQYSSAATTRRYLLGNFSADDEQESEGSFGSGCVDHPQQPPRTAHPREASALRLRPPPFRTSLSPRRQHYPSPLSHREAGSC